VPGAGEVISRVCKLDYGKPGKPAIDWDDPAAKEALISDLVNDALAVLGELAGPGAPERMRRRPTRWGCWRWWPGRTWSRRKGRTGRTGGGGSPGKWPRTG
jgi:hypothetical protein